MFFLFYILLFKDLIRQAENKLCLLESILYSKQYPVRDTSEQPSNSTLVKVQRCTSEMEEKLAGLVRHSQMLKKTKRDLEQFQHNTSLFLSDGSNLFDELKVIDKSNDEDFLDIEVCIFVK